jgi:outer membrane protein assembly factor BamB
MPLRAVQRSKPVLWQDKVIVGTRTGALRAFDRKTGRTAWMQQLPGAIEADMLADDTELYAGTITGGVYAIRAADGSIRWSHFARNEVLGTPVRYRDLIIFPTGGNQVMALHVTDGSWVWQFSGGEDPDMSIRGVAGLTVDGDSIYTGFSNGTISKMDAATGKNQWTERWPQDSRFEDIDSTPIVSNGRVYAIVYGARLLCLRAEDGGTVWTAQIQGHEAPVLANDVLYVPMIDGTLQAFGAEDGRVLWATKLGKYALTPPALQNGRLWLGDSDGTLYVVDAKTGNEVWRYKGGVSGFYAGATAGDDSTVYAISNLGHLFKFKPFRNK